MKISSIQLEIKNTRSKRETIAYAMKLIESCQGEDLIVLPELWNIGFFNYDEYIAESENINGETVSAIALKAKELGSYIYSGSFVEEKDGKYYNTSILFDREGRKVLEYRKMHLFSYRCKEPEILSPGDKISVVSTEFGRIGLATCYDLRFPELFRKMAIEYGAEIFLVTSAWPFPRVEAWNILNQARALENTCYLISCNAVGVDHGVRFAGHSQIVDPWGYVLVSSGYEEMIVKAEIIEKDISKIRKEFPVLKDLRLTV